MLKGSKIQRFLLYKKIAFTLAEVLITLGIIGIVAALTIPALITNIRHKELQTGLKEAHSSISQALKLYHAENGVPFTPISGAGRILKPAIMPYFRTAKDCGWGYGWYEDSHSACVPNPALWDEEQKESYKETYRTYNGKNSIRMAHFDDGQFIINNGILIMIEDSAAGIFMSVDVNGYDKKPNKLGQDLFMFQIDNSGNLLPMGTKGTYYYSATDAFCSKASTDWMNGAGCTVKALNDPTFFDNLP